MALLNNADIVTLAIKGKLIGSTFHFDDGTTKEIFDWELNMAIEQIALEFTDGKVNFFPFRDRFVIDVVVPPRRVFQGKVKKHKK